MQTVHSRWRICIYNLILPLDCSGWQTEFAVWLQLCFHTEDFSPIFLQPLFLRQVIGSPCIFPVPSTSPLCFLFLKETGVILWNSRPLLPFPSSLELFFKRVTTFLHTQGKDYRDSSVVGKVPQGAWIYHNIIWKHERELQFGGQCIDRASSVWKKPWPHLEMFLYMGNMNTYPG